MKKKLLTITFLFILITFLLASCKLVFPWKKDFSSSSSNSSDTESQTSSAIGSSPENLVPLGEYVQLGSENTDVQIQIKQVITGKEANELLGGGSEPLIIIIFNIKANKLNGSYFRTYSFLNMTMKNGLSENGFIGTASIEKKLNMKCYEDITFSAEGSVDCFYVFPLNIDECSYLVCSNGGGLKKAKYFSIK